MTGPGCALSGASRQLSQRESPWQAGSLSTGRLRFDRTQKGGPCLRGQRLLDNAPCQAVAGPDSGALPFPRYCASLVQTKAGRHANGSPFGGAGEEQGDETERARLLTANPRHSDSIALTKSLPIAAQRLFRAGLALSVTFGDTSPKGRGFGSPRRVNGFARGSPTRGAVERSETERLYEGKPFLCRKVRLLASPVSFWRNVWYNGFAALPAHFIREGR